MFVYIAIVILVIYTAATELIFAIYAANNNNRNPYFKYRIKEVSKNGETRYSIYRNLIFLWFYHKVNLISQTDLYKTILQMKGLKRLDKIAGNNHSKWLSKDDLRMEEL